MVTLARLFCKAGGRGAPQVSARQSAVERTRRVCRCRARARRRGEAAVGFPLTVRSRVALGCDRGMPNTTLDWRTIWNDKYTVRHTRHRCAGINIDCAEIVVVRAVAPRVC